jgi:hypothetical protein
MSTAVELRCNANPSRLLGKIKDPDSGVEIVEGNLIEIACEWCKQSERMKGVRCRRVLHRYNVAGELVETEVVK